MLFRSRNELPERKCTITRDEFCPFPGLLPADTETVRIAFCCAHMGITNATAAAIAIPAIRRVTDRNSDMKISLKEEDRHLSEPAMVGEYRRN